MKALRVVLNVVAVILLTDQITFWSMRAPFSAAEYIAAAPPWRWIHQAVASVRAALGANGPEQDDLLLLQCQILLSFVLAVSLVWAADRLTRLAPRSRLLRTGTPMPEP